MLGFTDPDIGFLFLHMVLDAILPGFAPGDDHPDLVFGVDHLIDIEIHIRKQPGEEVHMPAVCNKKIEKLHQKQPIINQLQQIQIKRKIPQINQIPNLNNKKPVIQIKKNRHNKRVINKEKVVAGVKKGGSW